MCDRLRGADTGGIRPGDGTAALRLRQRVPVRRPVSLANRRRMDPDGLLRRTSDGIADPTSAGISDRRGAG